MAGAETDVLRLDRWLWFARFFKSRSAATQFCADVRVRVNEVAVKPAHGVRAGDVLTFALRSRVCVVRVLALGSRRGPPAEARGLYEDLSSRPRPDGGPAVPDERVAVARRAPGSGRPTKLERRALDRLRNRD